MNQSSNHHSIDTHVYGDVKEDIQANDIGQLLETFYIILRNQPSTDSTRCDSFISDNVKSYQVELITAVNSLEEYVISQSTSDPEAQRRELSREIMIDCQKKCGQYLRISYQEYLRQIINNSKKKLTMKVSATVDRADALQRNSRHIHALMELVGPWSNLLVDVTSRLCPNLSKEIFHYGFLSLHERIVELIWDYYLQFIQDKNLESFKMKLHENEIVNLSLLDQLLEQYAQIAGIINRYLSFFETLYDNYQLCESAAVNIPLNLNLQSYESKKKELDWFYIVLESGYMKYVLNEAYRETRLLNIEGDCFIPQFVEDIVFLLMKISQRCMQWESNQCITIMHMRLVEFLELIECDDNSRIFPADTGSDIKISQVVTCKDIFYGAYSRGSVGNVLKIQSADMLEGRPTENSDKYESKGSYNLYESPTKGDISLKDTAAAVGAEVMVNVFNSASSWLIGSIDTNSSIRPSSTKKNSQADNPLRSAESMNFDDLILSALDVQSDSMDSFGEGNLSYQDRSILINSIGALFSGAQSIRQKFESRLRDFFLKKSLLDIQPDDDDDEIFEKHSKYLETIYMISLQELERLGKLYESYLNKEINRVAVDVMVSYNSQLNTSLRKNYIISGEEMEIRQLDSEVVRVVSQLLKHTSNTNELTRWGQLLSCSCFDLLLFHIAGLIADKIASMCGCKIDNSIAHQEDGYLLKFSEWGALLLYEEVLSIIKLFEEIFQDLPLLKIRNQFTKVLWVLKIVTLDQPGDIRRFNIPTEMFDGKQDDILIRNIMKTRVDFTTEAISKTKIIWI